MYYSGQWTDQNDTHFGQRIDIGNHKWRNRHMEKDRSFSKVQKWQHPGGKLREVGPEALSDTELLAILISSGIAGKPAEKIAEEIIERFGSFKGMANQPLNKFLQIKGLADVKIIRIAAAFEIARRIVKEVLRDHEKDKNNG